MGILRNLFLTGLLAQAALSTTFGVDYAKRDDDPCATGPGWASPVHFIGSKDETGKNCETQYGKDYTPIVGIEVWRNGNHDDRIAGIQFTYASQYTSPVYGHQDTSKFPSASLKMQAGETVKNCILYGNGKGEWLGHIHIETSNGQTFDAGRDTDGIDPYGINVGGGFLLGAVVYANDDDKMQSISKMAFLFLGQEIDHITIDNIKFDDAPEGSNSGISPKNIVVGRWFNHDSNNVGYSLSPTYAVTQSYAYSQTVSTSFGGGIHIEVSGELFGIGAKVTDDFTWSVGMESATTVATTSATSVACVASGTLKPSQGVEVTGAYQTGHGSFKYTSTVTVNLKDGTNYNYQESGTLDNIAYNECTTSFKSVNDSSISNSPGLQKPQKRVFVPLAPRGVVAPVAPRDGMPTPPPSMPFEYR